MKHVYQLVRDTYGYNLSNTIIAQTFIFTEFSKACYHTPLCILMILGVCVCKVCETHRLKVKWQKRTA